MAARVENIGAEDVEIGASNSQDEQINAILHGPAQGRISDVNHNSISHDSREPCFCNTPRNPAEYLPSDVLLRLPGNHRTNRLALYKAALIGDWKTAESIIKIDGRFLNSSITEEHQTALHVAAGAKQRSFVKKLVDSMEVKDLQLQDEMESTAFCLAVIGGSVPIAKILLEKVPNLALVRGGQNSTPLFIAVIFGRHEMAKFLFWQTEKHLDHMEWDDLRELFFTCIETDMFDLALKLLGKYDGLAVERKANGQTALHMLARKPSAFNSKKPEKVEKLINFCKDFKDNSTALQLVTPLWEIVLKKIKDVKAEIRNPYNLLLEAAELGNYEFLAAILRLYPELIWERDNMKRTIFHIAVQHRHVNIFNQIYSIGSIKDVVVAYDILSPASDDHRDPDNMLHLAAKRPSPHEFNVVPGPALQMQRELLWFQEVNSILQPSDRDKKGSEGFTPRELFTKEHKELSEKGEKWMRDTSVSCTLVATLITTVVYSAGFSTPGGNHDNGTPAQIEHTLFHVFAVSEAVALSFSITSTLMFLSILTSRYAEEDFLKSLPLKLMVGLATLFVSMMAMIVAFGSAFLLAYRVSYDQHKVRWIPLIVCGFAALPLASFVLLQFPLLEEIYHSTCRYRSMFRPKKSMFIEKLITGSAALSRRG